MDKIFKNKKGTNNQTIIIFIVCLVYLIMLPFLFDAISSDIPSMNYSSENESFFTGTFVGDFVNDVSVLPTWLNLLLIGIPFALLIITGALLILHG